MTDLMLAPAAHVFLRGQGAVQFGLDATRAGVLETDRAPALLAALLRARAPLPQPELLGQLQQAGFSPAAAHSLLADLVAYRILVSAPAGSVILLGRGRLADATAQLMADSGITVRTPLRGESEHAYLSGSAVDAPVLVLDRLAHSRTMAPLLARYAHTWITATIIDGRGVLGPLRIQGQGPCPMCGDLHRAATDSRWYPTVSQLPHGPVRPDPATVATTAARLLTLTQQLLGRYLHPPGTAVQQLAPGTVIEVDPYGPVPPPRILEPHPGCPVCWYF